MKAWFHPMSYVPHVSDIDFRSLRADGVRGVIVDLDNTLVGYRALEPEPEVTAWIGQAVHHEVRIIMVTNNATPWARTVAERLAVPIVANARKPLPRGFRRALRLLGLPREAAVVVGDQLFTDVVGAKLCGLRAILVEPLVSHDPWNTFPLRLLERWLLRGLPRTERTLAQRREGG